MSDKDSSSLTPQARLQVIARERRAGRFPMWERQPGEFAADADACEHGARALEFVKRLAQSNPWVDDSGPWPEPAQNQICLYCHNSRVRGTEGQHADDCLYALASALDRENELKR